MFMQFHSIEDIFEAFNSTESINYRRCNGRLLPVGKSRPYFSGSTSAYCACAEKRKKAGRCFQCSGKCAGHGCHSPALLGIGNDADGQELAQLLEKNNLSAEGLVQSKDRTTTTKHRIISGSQHLLRIDSEVDFPINAEERSAC
jgi:hypothetical protein